MRLLESVKVVQAMSTLACTTLTLSSSVAVRLRVKLLACTFTCGLPARGHGHVQTKRMRFRTRLVTRRWSVRLLESVKVVQASVDTCLHHFDTFEQRGGAAARH